MNTEILKKIANYCVYQERCHQEVIKKLSELGAKHEEADEFISWLITESYLNEERFGRHFASSKFRLKKWGKQKIKYELKMRGLSTRNIQFALSEISKEDYLQTIEKLIDEKKTKYRNLDSALVIRQKVLQALVLKGFSSEDVLEVYS